MKFFESTNQFLTKIFSFFNLKKKKKINFHKINIPFNQHWLNKMFFFIYDKR